MLVHERVDWGLAVVATLVSGGGKVRDHLPPWYDTAETDDDIMATLGMLAASKRWEKEKE